MVSHGSQSSEMTLHKDYDALNYIELIKKLESEQRNNMKDFIWCTGCWYREENDSEN